ncbi:MAG TPA: hypothetical protein VH539_14165 [Gemmatimonadaceae bacterium]
MRSLCRLAAVMSGIVACGSSAQKQAARDTGAATETSSVPATASATPGKIACPANGLWSDCAVFDALDRAGLAPRHDSAAGAITAPPLTQSGTRILIGSAALEVFVYPNAAARQRDEARLDKSRFIEPADEPTLRGEATLIRNVNLLAILHSRNDHQRERVSDALSAGLPQSYRAPK